MIFLDGFCAEVVGDDDGDGDDGDGRLVSEDQVTPGEEYSGKGRGDGGGDASGGEDSSCVDVGRRP